MRSKTQVPFNTKTLLIAIFATFVIIVVIRSSFSSSPEHIPSPVPPKDNETTEEKCLPTCNKIPSSVANAIIHYTTSEITPQQTLPEISVSAKILEQKSPCNFLIFGLGHDSLMWTTLNYNGHTIFLEEDQSWIDQMQIKFPMLKSHHVTYETKVNQADTLMEYGKNDECKFTTDPRKSLCKLALKNLPDEVYETKWDLIMVDAPTGYHDEAPGRMMAIYTAGIIARNRENGGETDVFVHDVNRDVEDRFSREFLCEGYMMKQEGRLRHFKIPSYRDNNLVDKSFCP